MKMKKIAVLGAGAVGSYVIWGLSKRDDISLGVVAEGERANRLKNGCIINGVTYHPEVWTPQEAQGADLLIAADCTAYAYGNLHGDFMQGKITLIGCPKLDSVDYSEKLSVIFGENDIQSITLTRMEVPCCGGLEMAVKRALAQCGKEIPLEVVTISLDGKILSRREGR